MGYEISLKLAWDELDRLGLEDCTVPFLGEDHLIRRGEREVLRPGGQPAGEMEAVLILDYLIGMARSGFSPSGSWISFKEAPAGVTFWPALEKSTIRPLAEALQKEGRELMELLQGWRGWRRMEGGDMALEVEALPSIMVRVIFWEGDEELPPEAAMLFDRALTGVYCTEDVAVLLMAVAQRINGCRARVDIYLKDVLSQNMRQVVIYPGEDGYFVAEVPSLPGCISQGESKEAALANIKEAIELYIAALQEDNLAVPHYHLQALCSPDLYWTDFQALITIVFATESPSLCFFSERQISTAPTK